MKRILLSFLILAAVNTCLAKYSGGTGEPQDPYQISSAADLLNMASDTADYGKWFILTRDINLLSSGIFTTALISPQGSGSFSGTFDGQGYKITNLKINTTGTNKQYLGLFGSLGGGMIKNLGVENINITTTNDATYVGCLLGSNNGMVINCYSKGTISIGGDSGQTGGLAGYNQGQILNSFSTGTVTGKSIPVNIGGLTGLNQGTINCCYSMADVNGAAVSDAAGGLAGFNGGIISNCYAQGKVIGYVGAGGLAGRNTSTIKNSYSTGTVSGTRSFGAFVGVNTGGITSCYFLNTAGPGNGLGTPVTGPQMKQQANFIGWDFVGEPINGPNDFWTIREGITYPKLSWQDMIKADLSISSDWMYQNLPGQTFSQLTAMTGINDPCMNFSYSYYWSFELPDDVCAAPVIVCGTINDDFCTFAAPSCEIPYSISDSGQTFKVVVKIIGNDYRNYGTAEKEFAIALLGDTNNDGVVNIADRSIINAFWRNGSAGKFTFKDCDLNCDVVVNIADRSIANSIWRGALGSNYVSTGCPLR